MRHIAFLLSLTLLLLVQSAQAQIQIGTAKGVVRDPTGALVSNASVTLDNTLTGFNASTTTSQEGEYVFNDVPFGSYVVRVRASGFQTAVLGVSIRSNIPLIGDVQLNVARVNESVNVGTSDTLVDSVTSATSTTIDRKLYPARAGRDAQQAAAKSDCHRPGLAIGE